MSPQRKRIAPAISIFDVFAFHHAAANAFLCVRADRGAVEFVATRQTDWDDSYRAFALVNAIFWPSRRAMRNPCLLRHEMAHVAQGNRLGHAWFVIAYWWETLRRGYRYNRFEIAARRAERREPRSRTRRARSG